METNTVWSVATSSLTGAGTAGKKLNDIPKDIAIIDKSGLPIYNT